ncbi:MAG TPA: AAA family ATPase [Alphaproteobacteria bacterium]|nr:AAA family ATPase [Alphaproteobacteria bacterium]
MFESIKFQNFRALRDTTLSLSPFTLIVGPNGSGKSIALRALAALGKPDNLTIDELRSAGSRQNATVSLIAEWKGKYDKCRVIAKWPFGKPPFGPAYDIKNGGRPDDSTLASLRLALDRARFYSLDAAAIAAAVQLNPNVELANTGANLAGVLDRLRDQQPERFDSLNEQLGRWIPEFDKVLFETPETGHRSIALRTRDGGHLIKARNLSQGTLIALALLTMAYLPEPPSIVCLEEPDRGLHPRLLQEIRNALYRLAYPEACRENRAPVQVIATTHNPFFLDLFRDRPEEIVIAEKIGLEAKFSRLSDREDLDKIIGDASLSEVWYSGALGGVPAGA